MSAQSTNSQTSSILVVAALVLAIAAVIYTLAFKWFVAPTAMPPPEPIPTVEFETAELDDL